MADSTQPDLGAVDMDFSAAIVPKPTYLLVLHDFKARSPDELTLKKGERVELLLDDAEFGDGWYLGRSLTTNERGLFPEVYTTRIIVQDDASKPPKQASANRKVSKTVQTVEQEIRPLSKPGSETASHQQLAPSPVPQGASGFSNTSPLIVDKGRNGRVSIERNPTLVEAPSSAQLPTSQYPGHQTRSAVVEDTLSDIEEAISELSAQNKIIKNHSQRHSQTPIRLPEPAPQEIDSGSEYSRDNDVIESDSDVEDPPARLYGSSEITYTVDEVSHWTPAQVAEYLRSRNVTESTCDKFDEQEVSGAILLQLQMADLKELDLGSFGKRFEVWKEIEHLVESLQSKPKSRGSNSVRLSTSSKEASPRPRSSTVGTGILPRIKSQHDRPPSRPIPRSQIDIQGANAYLSNSAMHPPGSAATFIAETPMSALFEQPRPPPESPPQGRNRQVSGSSRDSFYSKSPSMSLGSAIMAGTSVLTAHGGPGPHRRDSSFDRNWKLSTATSQNRPSTSHKANVSSGTTDSVFTGDSGFSGSSPQTPMVTEKSYFSGNESSSKGRTVLQKKNSSSSLHHRKTSYTEEQRVRAGTALSRHSKFGSTDTVRGGSSPSLALPKDKSRPKSNSFSDTTSFGFDQSAFSTSPQPIGLSKKGTSDLTANTHLNRSASEKIGSGSTLVSPISVDSSRDALFTTSVSVIIEGGYIPEHERDRSSHGSRAAASAAELRKKSKKHNTSAWQEGLRNITPFEAAKEADFSGWMNKRGSGSLATWKPRFFVLNGRRLSYFYAENDTKERGLIDVTSHKVLAATSDRLVNIHATLAAATSPSTSPVSTATSPQFFKSLESPNSDRGGEKSPKRSPLGPHSPLSPPISNGEQPKDKEHKERGWFTFKLVPPAPGAARGVTFTPPRVHYFATDTKETGKAWMAAIMKATIEIDVTKPVTTSYSAQTISLAKARALRARPPDLAVPSGSSTGGSSVTGDSTKGLAITGIDIDQDNDHGDADVEENGDGDAPSRSVSRAGSHNTNGTTGTGSDKFGLDSKNGLSSSAKGNFLLGMSGAGDVRSMGSGSLRSPSLEKLLSSEEVQVLNSVPERSRGHEEYERREYEEPRSGEVIVSAGIVGLE